MENLPDELRERVLRLNAELLTGLVRPGDAVWLACELLAAGVDSPTLAELAGESPTRLTSSDAVPLVRQTLAELGIVPIAASQAPWVVARDIARQMIAGELLPEHGARSLWGLWWRCDNAAEIGSMIEPLEIWDATLPADRDDDAIRAELRELARGVVLAATARLAAGGLIDP